MKRRGFLKGAVVAALTVPQTRSVMGALLAHDPAPGSVHVSFLSIVALPNWHHDVLRGVVTFPGSSQQGLRFAIALHSHALDMDVVDVLSEELADHCDTPVWKIRDEMLRALPGMAVGPMTLTEVVV